MDALSQMKMVARKVSHSEQLILLMIKVFSDTPRFKIFQLVETLTKSLDLYKLSNTLMNSVRSAQPVGNQVAKPWFQMLMQLKQKNISKDNEDIEQANFGLIVILTAGKILLVK